MGLDDSVNRAGHLAAAFSALKALGVHDRRLYNDILRRSLLANPALLGVWSVWEPNALDGRDQEFAGTRGHDESGRFVPLWHRCGGRIRLEANTGYEQPSASWYLAPRREGAEMVIDPYEYSVGGQNLWITSQAAPIFHRGQFAGVAGFDIHVDALFASGGLSEASLDAVLGRRHVLLGPEGEVRSCSPSTYALLCRYAGGSSSSARRLPEPLRSRVLKEIRTARSCSQGVARWIFSSGRSRTLVVRLRQHPLAARWVLLVEEKERNRWEGPELSPRELDVAKWLVRGKSNDEIGIILGISGHTVKNHLDKIFRKLGVENRHAAAISLQRESALRVA